MQKLCNIKKLYQEKECSIFWATFPSELNLREVFRRILKIFALPDFILHQKYNCACKMIIQRQSYLMFREIIIHAWKKIKGR